MQGSIIAAREVLNQKREAAAGRAGVEEAKAFEEAKQRVQDERTTIEVLATPVANAIQVFDSYAKTIAFDPLDLDTWRTPVLPTQRHAGAFKPLQEKIDRASKTFVTELRKSELISANSPEAPIQYSDDLNESLKFLNDAMGRIGTTDTGFSTLSDRGIGPLVVVGIAVGVGLVLVLFLNLGFKFQIALKHGDILGLLKRSEDVIRNLEFEVTQSRGGNLNLPLLQRLGASFNLSEERRGRALTLPGLTARYIEYIHDVQRVLGARYGSPKLIICIDELDKITDPKQVGHVLREIKGALYERDCFYLLSISEDAVRAFEGRLVEQRDIFESTFDEILFIERLDLETCLSIARRRCERAGYGPNEERDTGIEEAMEIAAVLSTGVPRELLRNLRALESEAGQVLNFEPSLAWHTLYERKLSDLHKKVRTADGLDHIRADLIGEIEQHLSQCHEGYDQNAVRTSLPKIRERTKNLARQSASLQKEADTADRDQRAAALDTDIQQIRAWIRSWTELEVHLLVRLCSLLFDRNNPIARSDAYANLLKAYAGLPYSTEATARRLSEFSFSGECALRQNE